MFESDATNGPSRADWARRAAALIEEYAAQRAEICRLNGEVYKQSELIVELEFEIVRLKEELALARALKI